MLKKLSLISLLSAFAVAFGFTSTAPSAFAAGAEMVLFSFGSANGVEPRDPLVFDPAGNLYGTTYQGGANGQGGTVFQLTRGADGTWAETVLYSFCTKPDCRDGYQPSAGLAVDGTGDLYGTALGGVHRDGEVFEISSGTNGAWSETVPHSFDGKNGNEPYGGLIFDAAGNLYGTTTAGGAHKSGTVFEMMLGADGKWTENVLHSFNGKDGRQPMASLVFDSAGNLYGTTLAGGAHNGGTVFQLTPGKDGKWGEKLLLSFDSNGKNPHYPSGVILDAAGNLYGATVYGGAHGGGAVFQLTPDESGKWTEKVLYSFCSASRCADGSGPGGLVFDASGNLFGATGVGGTGDSCGEGCGTVFELTRGTNGEWTETVLYNFEGGNDAAQPNSLLIFDAAGNLYGTSIEGGTYDGGTVFEISP